ncbi:MAG: hypothetical protein KKG73_09555 [Gammaproteobacteria bacterium]|nr:hypothetical protein [Gammaproteobacteria bacterium]
MNFLISLIIALFQARPVTASSGLWMPPIVCWSIAAYSKVQKPPTDGKAAQGDSASTFLLMAWR